MLATRMRHQVNRHADFDRDETQLAAHYAVQGTDKVLVLATWISHEMAEDTAVIGALLEWLDRIAQEDAAHPEDFPLAQWFCT